MDRRRTQALIAFAAALSLAPLARAEAQVRSAVARVQLTAIVLPGASFRLPLGPTLNAPYRVELHRPGGSNVALTGEEPPGLVSLKAVRDSLKAAGLAGEGQPVTVDLVLDAGY
ncbi:MAG: hypothetical protein ACM3NS_05330 [Deltaproteobacteria bacterium]